MTQHAPYPPTSAALREDATILAEANDALRAELAAARRGHAPARWPAARAAVDDAVAHVVPLVVVVLEVAFLIVAVGVVLGLGLAARRLLDVSFVVAPTR